MNPLQQIVWQASPTGRIDAGTLARVVTLAPLFPVSVICDGLRFTCAAADVRALSALVTLGGATVERLEFPTGSVDLAADWRAPVLARGARVPVQFGLPSEAMNIEFA